MTIYKSDAVVAGIMPDFTKAGVILCRSAEYVTADDEIVSADTIQMVPIPNDAKILRIEMYHSDLPDGTTDVDVGYGGDADAFMAGIDATGKAIRVWPGRCGSASTEDWEATAGFLHTFTADDTIDITFNKLGTKIPTSQHIKMAVYYKMIGTIADET